MDTPGQSKKKRDSQKNRVSQRRYRERQKAAFNGIEEVRARNCQRYYVRMAYLKDTGQYEAFKAKKAKEGMQRYHAMSEEQRNEVKRKKLILQKAWRERMIREGTYEEYRRRLNARRRQQMAEKKRAMGIEGWRALQRAKYVRRAKSKRRKRCNWLDEHLARPFPLPWLPLEWAESEPEKEEEDTVQTIRTNALEQIDQYL